MGAATGVGDGVTIGVGVGVGKAVLATTFEDVSSATPTTIAHNTIINFLMGFVLLYFLESTHSIPFFA
jgi:Na+-driven multidrug efflux pump